jgi:hypothetical protein
MSDVPLPEPTPGCWWDAEAIAAMHTYAAAVSADLRAENAALREALDEAESLCVAKQSEIDALRKLRAALKGASHE